MSGQCSLSPGKRRAQPGPPRSLREVWGAVTTCPGLDHVESGPEDVLQPQALGVEGLSSAPLGPPQHPPPGTPLGARPIPGLPGTPAGAGAAQPFPDGGGAAGRENQPAAGPRGKAGGGAGGEGGARLGTAPAPGRPLKGPLRTPAEIQKQTVAPAFPRQNPGRGGLRNPSCLGLRGAAGTG